MKKLLLILFLLFSFAPMAWGASQVAAVGVVGTSTKYKTGNLSNCSDADGWTTGSTLQAASTAASTNTLFICSGTYTASMINAAATLTLPNSQTLTGAGQDLVTLDGAGLGATIITGGNPSTISGITIANSDSTKHGIYTTASITISDVIFINNYRHVWLNGSTTATLTRCRMYHNSDPNYYIAISAATFTANYCLFENGVSPVSPIAAGTINFNNCDFIGFYGYAISNQGTTPTVTFNNGIFSSNNAAQSVAAVVNVGAGGTWNFNNCIKGVATGESFTFGAATVNNSNNSTASDPLFQKLKQGKIFLFTDDSENLATWKTRATTAGTYGLKMSFAMVQSDAGAVDFEALSTYITAGHEIASHGYSGARLGTTNAMNSTKVGSQIVIAVTRTDPAVSSTWTGTLQLDAEAAIDLASAGYDTMGEVVTYLAGKGVTIATATSQLTMAGAKTKSLCLASGTYNINTVQTLLFDETSFFLVEMKESKTWLEAQIQPFIPTWTAKSFVWSGGLSSASGRTYALGTAGYSQARALSGSTYIAFLDQSQVQCKFATLWADNIASRTANLLKSLETFGGIGGLIDHGDFSAANWAIVFATVSAYTGNVQNDTFSGAMDWVRANDDHVTGTTSYGCSTNTESCFMNPADYKLQAGSPAINAGVDVGLTSDYAGRPVPQSAGKALNVPGIGAYEFEVRRKRMM